MAIMHPRLAVSVAGVVDAKGHLAVPKNAAIWTIRFPMKIGPYEAYEYRNAQDDLFVVMKVAAVTTRVLSVIYVPVPEDRDDAADLKGLRVALAPVIAKSWSFSAFDRAALAALEADNTALATAVKGALPVRWRKQLDTDFVLDANGKPVATDPTGERIIGDTLR